MAAEPDRLSELPDDLLQHILHLAPCREAESTAVLLRRWRGLWPPSTGAVKIDIPSRDTRFRFDAASLRAAEGALAASQGPVERLAIDVGVGYHSFVHVVGGLLSHPASRGVQDVRISAESSNSDVNMGGFQFSFVSVPSAALRVLHLTNCSDVTPALPPFCLCPPTFPCLEVLWLRRCIVELGRLQDMVAASPLLAALQLEHVHLCSTPSYNYGWGSGPWEDLAQSFCCPGVTTLVLLDCYCENDAGVELDVPRVQHFKYRGKINQFTRRSPLPDVRRAYLHIILDCYRSAGTCRSFWSYLKNLSATKVLKLKLDWPIDSIAALERCTIRDLLIGENQNPQTIRFCVEHLEIDAPHNPDSKHVGVAIGNLLQCCPALHDLRLKLNTTHRRRSKTQLEFHKSIDHFRHRRDCPVVPLCGDDGKFEVSDIPGLSDRWIHFGCLRFHLRRLSLQIQMDMYNPNCIGIRLVKFFIKTGMALEEMYIHDGNMKMWEHMNCMISGSAANSQPISEYQVWARISQELSMNQFSSSKTGCFHPHKLEVRRTNPWFASRSFTILPLVDK